MSFASNARAEMARELCAEKCCSRAELAAALLALPTVLLGRWLRTRGAESFEVM